MYYLYNEIGMELQLLHFLFKTNIIQIALVVDEIHPFHFFRAEA